MNFYDAHNHLQDERLRPHVESIIAATRAASVRRMVVNGACESDWPNVLKLARTFPEVLPSFGYHPWYAGERSENWKEKLTEFLSQFPSAIGEIGLDRWIKNHDFAVQQEIFVAQLQIAAQRGVAVSIHCLEAWGPMLENLQRERPPRGFVLHSYGGSREMVPIFAKLGAYFSLPGYFAHDRKTRQRETFKHVPPDRLLIETDAPDQLLPDERNRFPLLDAGGKAINHPANLRTVYEFGAELLGLPLDELAGQVESNFLRLFT